jgi:hypothetical protein
MYSEPVIIITTTDTLHGHLCVGHDGLPTLCIESGQLGPTATSGFYWPATLPNNWQVRSPRGDIVGPLLASWYLIDGIRERLAVAQREAQGEERDPMDQAKADMEARGER